MFWLSKLRKHYWIEASMALAIVAICLSVVWKLSESWAIEIMRTKNASTYFVVPMISATNTSIFKTAATVNPYITYWNSTTIPGNFTATAANGTEIQATGIYYVPLNASEMNHDYIGLKLNATGALDQYILIATDAKLASVSDKTGFSLAADQSAVTIGTMQHNSDKTGYTASTVSDKTGYSLAADQSAVSIGTMIHNSDKTGYTVTTVSDKTGYSLAADQSAVTIGTMIHNSDKSGYTVTTVSDKTGYSLAADQSAVTIGTMTHNSDKTGYSLAADQSAVSIGTMLYNADKTGYTVTTVSDKTGYSLSADQSAVTIGTMAHNSDKAGYSLAADQSSVTIGTMKYIEPGVGTAVWSTTDRSLTGTQTFNLTGNVTGNISGSIGSFGTQAKTDVENSVWSANASSYNVAGTTGNKLNSAASAGDPWTTNLPGSYTTGQAGYIIGNNLNASVSSRGTSNLTVSNLSSLTNVTLAGTQVFNNTGNWNGNVSNVTNGVSLSSSSIQSIWDTLTSALTSVGSIGKLLVDNINAAIASRMATFTLPGNFSALNITSDGNVTTSSSGGATAQQVWEYSNRNVTINNSSNPELWKLIKTQR